MCFTNSRPDSPTPPYDPPAPRKQTKSSSPQLSVGLPQVKSSWVRNPTGRTSPQAPVPDDARSGITHKSKSGNVPGSNPHIPRRTTDEQIAWLKNKRALAGWI